MEDKYKLTTQKLNRLKDLYFEKDNEGKFTDISKPGKIADNHSKMAAYIRYRRNEGMADNTLANDAKCLIELTKVISKPVKEMTEDDIYLFFDELNSKAKNTSNHYKIRLRGFLRTYIKREDLAALCKVKQSKTDRKLPSNLLTQKDIEKLLLIQLRNLRDKAYIALLYESGARRGEIINMLVKHIEFDENGASVTFPEGKTGARRIRVVWAVSHLRNWIDSHPLRKEGDSWKETFLWVSFRDYSKIVDPDTLFETLRRTAKAAGISKAVNPHSFRKARATHLAKHLTEAQMKTYLGWTADSSMAAIYVHLSGRDVDNSILEMYGIKPEEKPEEEELKAVKCPRCKEFQRC